MSYTQQGEKIALAAREWLGTPHVNGARVKGKGVDCGMLLIGALEDAGVIKKDAIEIAPYSPEFHLHNRREWKNTSKNTASASKANRKKVIFCFTNTAAAVVMPAYISAMAA